MNCLTYVLRKIRDERASGRRGGYILIRRSYLAKEFGITSSWNPVSWVPHFLHRDQDGVVTQFGPTPAQAARNKRDGLLIAVLRLWSFEGYVFGDDDANKYRNGVSAGPIIFERQS